MTLLPYYGGKNRPCLRDAILRCLAPNEGYLEAFCGSAGILLNRPPSRIEIANDADGLLVNFFRVLREDRERLVEVLKLTPFARAEREACIEALKNAESLDRIEMARCWYAAIAMSHVGELSGGMRADPVSAARFAGRIRDDLHRIAERLASVCIENRDAVEIVGKWASDPGWTIYCDPPYLYETRARGSRETYRVDNSEDLHERLLEAVQGARAQVVISTYRNPLYDRMLKGWQTISIDVDNPSSKASTSRRAVEAIYANRLPASGLFD